MKINFLPRFLLCLVLLTGSVGGALAQGTASRVTGTVLDQSGGIVPDASVTLINEGTRVSLTTQTDSTGNYVFDAVQVGLYTVTVERQGFKKFVTTTNQVNVNQPATIDVTLEPGGVTEVVTVEGSAELVQTGSSGNFGNTVEEKALTTLPIVGSRGRNPLSFILFQPGVTPDANTGGGVHVHGSRDRAFNFTLDGIDINDTTSGGSNFTPIRANPDSLSQFQVVTGNFTAELGRSSGAQVSLITKSGTNEFHGNLFEFYQTPRFHANEYQNGINTVLVNGQRVPTGKPQFVQHIFGGSIGGPVYLPRFGEGGPGVYNGKNRTFFFVNLQNLRTSQAILRNRTVYTEQARAGRFRYVANGQNGNLLSSTPSIDAAGNAILPTCPATITATTPRCIATFNVANNPNIPLSFDPTTTALIGLTPLPNNFTLGDGLNTAGFTFVAPQTERQYDFTTKIDHSFNERNNIYVRYSRGAQNTLGDNANGGLQAFPGLPNIVDTFRSPRNLAVNYRATLSPNVVNEFVAGFNRFTFSFNNPDPNAAINTPVILNNVTDPLNASPSVNNARRVTTRQFVDNLSWARNAHTFKFGTNIRLQQHVDDRSSVAGTNTRESVSLSTANNAVPASFGTRTAATTGINTTDRGRLESYVNDIFGRIGSITQGFVATDDGSAFAPAGSRFLYDARYPELDFYAQDTWKLRPNFTIDYGLRWEVRLSPRAPNDLILRPDRPVRVGEQATNALNFVEGKLYDDQYKQFSPSVGFAYDPFGTGKTSIRANYRLAYDRTNTFVFSSFIFQSAPGLTRAITVRATDSIFNGANNALLRNGLPVLSATDRTPQQFRTPPAFSVNTLTVVDPDLSYPRTHQYGVSFQRDIGKGNVVEVNYIGRQGRKLFGGYDVNQMDINNNGLLDAFRTLQNPATRASVVTDPNFLINRLLAGDTRLGTVTVGGVSRPETGAELLLRQASGPVRLTPGGPTVNNIVDAGGVANAAAFINAGVRSSNTAVPVFQANGFSPFFFQPYPQFSGAVNVLDNNDESHYNALEIQISRRSRGGLGYQASYTLAKSTDTRSFDPTFAIANRGSVQSAANTPFDIRDRRRNLARSDFDRRHALQGYFTYELPFGRNRRFLSDANGFVDRLVGGFEFAGIMRVYSGRPFTVFSGLNTLSNVLQSPASCNGCTPDMGRVALNAAGRNAFFTSEQTAQFFAPAAGELGNTGRNFFNGPGYFQLDITIGKRIKFDETRNLELRMEAQNATNTPIFDFPTAVISSTAFGVINDAVLSSSRKVQFAAKFNF
ncbi:MAG TPA: carboxypeptidase regulatory-like domain-containing protein [Pyrinomonadaceae bacterium]|nr:carboxypeptidase regulatory-like domain-containing protein [Pyrinomonadaceae bacterium]